jgi:hypothetical protein
MAIHSQTSSLPSTPSGWNVLWSGYSFLGWAGGNSGFINLESPGSCLPEFRPIPGVECGGWNSCDFDTSDDFGYWLSAVQSDSGTLTGTASILPIVSRCIVVEAPKAVLTRHTQTTSVPGEISGWTKLWDGYSYLYTVGGSGNGNLHDLGSPGSCLPILRPIPFLECSNTTQCDNFTGGDFGYWLAAVTVDSGNLTGAASYSTLVSRCSVYSK